MGIFRWTVLICILACNQSFSDTFYEIVGGSITYHIIGSNLSNDSNKLSKDGKLIDNPIIGFTKTDINNGTFTSISIFGGENTVGGPIVGSFFQIGWDWKYLQLGGVIGFYFQTDNQFRGRGIVPFDFDIAPNFGIVPVAGAVINLKLPINDMIYLKINNVISPIITNTTASIGFKF